MDYNALMSLAQKNDHKAQVKIKSSVPENLAPLKPVKTKPDLRVVQAQLEEHKRAQQAEKAKLNFKKHSGCQNHEGPGSRLPTKTGLTNKYPNGPDRPSISGKHTAGNSTNALNRPTTAPGLSAPAKSNNSVSSGKGQISSNASGQHALRNGLDKKQIATGNGLPAFKSRLSSSTSGLAARPSSAPPRSTPASQSRTSGSTQPPSSTSTSTSTSKAPRPEVQYKPKIRPAAAPPPSFSALLRMASAQQLEPEKSVLSPPDKCNTPLLKEGSYRSSLPSSSHSNVIPRREHSTLSTGNSSRPPRREENARPTPSQNKRVAPISSSSLRQETSQKSSVSALVKNSQPRESLVKRPAPSSLPASQNVKKNTQIHPGAPQNQPPGRMNGVPVRSDQRGNVGSQSGPRPYSNANGVSRPSITPYGNTGSREANPRPITSRGQPPAPRPAIPSVSKQPNLPGRKIAPVGGKVSAVPGHAPHSSSRPNQPPPQRVSRAYPNGPSFPAFRPPARKRPLSSRRDEEDSEYDEDMADFIDDGETEGAVPGISDQIREIFGYDRRKYANLRDDDDDLRGMETGIHKLWQEEERSAAIAELEDEIEEIEEEKQLEAERRALLKKRDEMRKRKKMKFSRYDDEDDDDD